MKALISKSVMCSLLVLSAVGSRALAASDSAMKTTVPMEEVSRPHFGFNLEPIWLVVSGVGAKAEYFVSDTVSVGFGGIFIPKHTVETSTTTSSTYNGTKTTTGGDYKWEHTEMFLGANIMLMGTLGSRGLYINPAVGYATSRVSEFSDSNLSGELSSPMARMTVGYQWILARHLRLAAGGGLTLAQASDIKVKDDTGKEVLNEKSTNLGGLALDLQVGYVF
jgi:hypothetical protein